MNIYQGIYIDHIQYNGIPNCTTREFVEAAQRYMPNQTVNIQSLNKIRKDYGDHCRLYYDYDSSQYEVDHFYFSSVMNNQTEDISNEQLEADIQEMIAQAQIVAA